MPKPVRRVGVKASGVPQVKATEQKQKNLPSSSTKNELRLESPTPRQTKDIPVLMIESRGRMMPKPVKRIGVKASVVQQVIVFGVQQVMATEQ